MDRYGELIAEVEACVNDLPALERLARDPRVAELGEQERDVVLSRIAQYLSDLRRQEAAAGAERAEQEWGLDASDRTQTNGGTAAGGGGK